MNALTTKVLGQISVDDASVAVEEQRKRSQELEEEYDAWLKEVQEQEEDEMHYLGWVTGLS